MSSNGVNSMKNLNILLIGLFLLSIFWGGEARAEAVNQDAGVDFKANVLERKMTDTINDFTVDGVDYTKPSFKAVLGASTDVPSNTQNQPQNPSPQHQSPKFRWQNLLFLSPVYDVYYLVAHWRELKISFLKDWAEK